ncbi:hypothetical protein NQ318_001962 [Aromia moschata]|uniref:Intimal thickness related receptor IRP domain-containing protein n=1 Tax=Aromia moschata TaxID=1265417 RepID=A0AAV8Z1M3_9CUCU|nr:hypothetical protein NQ318_001962 [Aromia moschata]
MQRIDRNSLRALAGSVSGSCVEKEALLNIKQNQIVNLTTRHLELSGCSFLRQITTMTPSPRYTISVPTLITKKNGKKPEAKESNFSITSAVTTEETPTMESSTALFNTYFESTATTDNDITRFYTTENLLEETSIATTSENALSESDYGSTTTHVTTEFFDGVEESRKPPIKKRSIPSKLTVRRYTQRSRTIVCHQARRFRSSRERWWFIAISNCNGTRGIDIKYRLLMTNGPPGDYWHEHFSADEFYILPVLMAFSVAYSFLTLAVVMCSIELRSRQLLHTTYKIFVASDLLQFFGILFESICYLKYAVSGVPAVKVKRFGAVLIGASETCFLLLLLLLAKGYTITRGRLPLPASIKLTIFMCLYTVTYMSIFIYEAKVFDPGEVLYLYESPAGYSLITLRVVAWCMFIYSTIFTIQHYPEKANFYFPFNVFGTIWFLAGPAFILSANTYIDKWVRESVVCAVLHFITFGGHLMFLILTMPSVANKNFPYHVRTTQIGVMEMAGNGTGNYNIDQFSHHVYEPTTTIQEETVIIPLTKRTEEIFEDMYKQRALQKNITNEEDNDELPINYRDPVIDNVLSWSVAKNVSTLELPAFQRVQYRRSTTSTNSRMSDDSNQNGILSGNRPFSPVSSNRTPKGNFDDYVKEVPVELFTVSKMVVTKSNKARVDIESE